MAMRFAEAAKLIKAKYGLQALPTSMAQIRQIIASSPDGGIGLPSLEANKGGVIRSFDEGGDLPPLDSTPVKLVDIGKTWGIQTADGRVIDTGRTGKGAATGVLEAYTKIESTEASSTGELVDTGKTWSVKMSDGTLVDTGKTNKKLATNIVTEMESIKNATRNTPESDDAAGEDASGGDAGGDAGGDTVVNPVDNSGPVPMPTGPNDVAVITPKVQYPTVSNPTVIPTVIPATTAPTVAPTVVPTTTTPTTTTNTTTMSPIAGVTETTTPTYGNYVASQGQQFADRAVEQQALYQPQTLAEKQAAGQNLGQIEQRLFVNPQGMSMYVMFINGQPQNPIPQGYRQVQQPVAAAQGGYIQGFQEGGVPVTARPFIKDTPVTAEEIKQAQANTVAQATINPAGSIAAAPVANIDPNKDGTVIESTAGQAGDTAPIVTTVQQVDETSTTDVVSRPMVDAEGNPVYEADGTTPKMTTATPVIKAGVTTTQEDTKNLLEGKPILDADGNPVMKPAVDTSGKPIMEAVLDASGNPVYEADGTTPKMTAKMEVVREDSGVKAAKSDGPTETVEGQQQQRQKKDADGNLMFEADGKTPVMETYTQLEDVKAAQIERQKIGADGKPMFELDGVTPIMEAAPQTVKDAPTRTLQDGSKVKQKAKLDADGNPVIGADGQPVMEDMLDADGKPIMEDSELVDGSAVDQTKVGEAFGKGEVKAASVKDELTTLMDEFEGGDTPAWAAGSMRKANQMLAARGLGASSMAGQAIIQAAMEAALPIAQIDAGNKQQMALFKGEQRAKFLQIEFDQDFQSKIINASKVSEIANMNFNAAQEIALENAKMAQTVDIANLNNRQAVVMAEAAQIASLETQGLSNIQQAQVENAKNFLQIDMANLANEQQTEIFKSQTLANSILSDAASKNAQEQFNVSSENQATQFDTTMATQVSQFNSAQANAMKQFNANEANTMAQFNSEIQNQREQFNSKAYAVIAQANAKWRQDATTMNTAAANQSNFEYAKEVNGLTNKVLDQIWQRERDLMGFAFTGEQASFDRVLAILLGDKGLEEARMAADAQEGAAKTSLFARAFFGEDGLFSN